MEPNATSDRSRPVRGDTGNVGFDPHRARRRTPFDYAMVALALAVCAGLVVWALVG
jgi:hypothetical protein